VFVIVVKPGTSYLNISYTNLAIKTRAQRVKVILESGEEIVVRRASNKLLIIETPRGEQAAPSVKIATRTPLDIAEHSGEDGVEIVVYRAVYVY
jgi:hypothetical protein